MLILLLTSLSFASFTYPDAVAGELGAACSPACTVCHETNAGGGGTVVQPFGVAMMDRGLVGGSDSTALADALALMADEAVDSDGDGELDVDELAAGVDPNPDGLSFCDLITPTYGCATGGPRLAGGLALVLAGLMLGLRRR